MWLDEAQRLLKRWEGAVLRIRLQATSFVENYILQHGSAISHILCICFYFREWIIFYPLVFLLFFFCSCKGRRMWCCTKEIAYSSKKNKKWGCLQLYRHSFFRMLCLNMPLMAVYIFILYIYIYVYFFLNYWCLIAQGCRKSYKVLRALWELEWFMRLCCFCSMRKLDVAYRILPCCYCCRVCSCCLALMLRHVAESALSIHALNAWP